jgi:hypothetical protein
VLTSQRDRYLPLRVIVDHLASVDERTLAHPPRPALVAVRPPGDAPPPRDPADPARPSVSRLSRAELLARSGLEEAVLTDIERLGLIVPTSPGRYDADGLSAALVAPLARQRDPIARGRAAEVLREAVGLSQQLHGALLRTGLRQEVGRVNARTGKIYGAARAVGFVG